MNEINIIEKRIEEWKHKLIDLTRRNRLLYFRKTKRSTLEIYQPNISSIFKRLFLQEKKWKFWLPPKDEQHKNVELLSQTEKLENLIKKTIPKKDDLVCKKTERNDLELSLKNIYRRARTEEQERGIKILYITFGLLKWQDTAHTDFNQAPLVLCPIELNRISALDPFTLNLSEDDIFLNPALNVKLQKDFNFELPQLPEDWKEDSLEDYLDLIKQEVKKLNWLIEKKCFIGIFSFHKLSMYQDLSDNASLIKKHPLLLGLSGACTDNELFTEIVDERKLDIIQKPEKTYQILDADSSQQQSIQSALQRKSFVLQGPPGTGKSQTIANIISEFIARGKTVLFVSEKMAALEVVFNRLNENSLGDFCLELHSHKAKKREVINELKRCLDERIKVDDKTTEEDFEKLKRLRNKLNNYTQSLHEIRMPLNKNIYDVIGELINLERVPFIDFKIDGIKDLSPVILQEWEGIIEQLALNWQVIQEGPNFPWIGNKEPVFTPITAEGWKERLTNFLSIIQKLEIEVEEFSKKMDVTVTSKLVNIKWLIQAGDYIICSPALEKNWLDADNTEELINIAEKLKKNSLDYHEKKDILEKKYKKDFFELPMGLLEKFKKNWNTALKLAKVEDNYLELFEKREQLLKFLKDTLKITEDYLSYTNKLLECFNMQEDNLTLNRMKEIAELSLLCGSTIKPESKWFEAGCLMDTNNLIKEIRPQYEDYNNRKNTLLTKYDESFLDLDLEKLIENFSSFFYSSPIRWINPWYYKAKKDILHASRKPEILPSLLDDLCEARELSRIDKKLNSREQVIKDLFGRYYKGYETDFNLLIEALSMTSLVIKLSSSLPVSKELINLIIQETPSSSDILKIGNNIFEFLEMWKKEYEEFSHIIPLEEEKKSFEEAPLSDIRNQITKIISPLKDSIDIGNKIISFAKEDYTVNFQKIILDMENKESLDSIQTFFRQDKEKYISNFGVSYCGVDTDWNDIIKRLTWTQEWHKLFEKQISQKIINFSLKKEEAPDVKNLEIAYREAIEQLDVIESFFFKPAPVFQGKPFRKLLLKEMYVGSQILLESLDSLHMWINFKKVKKLLGKFGLNLFLREITTQIPEASQLSRIFRKSIYLKWLDNIFAEEPILANFTGISHENLINEFREIDRKLIELTPQRVIRACDSRKPREICMKTQDTEIGILKREAAKKRKHLPIRYLFKKIPGLLMKLKPCLLMSPISVSQYIHPNIFNFDIIIFDEASQIFTEDAAGAILRGKQLVVAGDSKQLPPTNFFRASETDDDIFDEEDYEQSSADFESVLEECSTFLPSIPDPFLKWHYRSRDESLITFSNQKFYQNKLVTFPSSEFNGKSLGVRFIYVPDGIYDRGGKRNNEKEASVVVNMIFEHFKLYPQKSLGVVAFSQTQMTTIEDEVELRLRQFPEFKDFFNEDRLEGFFVKNLENVQGDERDAIIFSIGYGYDQDGRITMNFGPLNKLGGERRLNVAVTRAREKVLVISSIKAADIDLRRTDAAGVIHLYNYLDYAERGNAALKLTIPFKDGESESPFEESVANEIRNLGYNVSYQVGCSGYRIDIGVLDPSQPGRFLLGVECDGATYHSAYTARDRDRLRQDILENLGWNIYRIWSPDWMNKKSSEIRKLKEAIEKAKTFSNKINKKLSKIDKKKT